MRCYEHQWTMQWPTSAWPWAWYKRADPSTFCKITKVSTPHKAHFATFPALKKCFLTAAMSTTLHELSLFHVAGWQQLFFLHLSSCFYYLHTMLSTSVQGHRHLQLLRTTIRSPTDLNKSNVNVRNLRPLHWQTWLRSRYPPKIEQTLALLSPQPMKKKNTHHKDHHGFLVISTISKPCFDRNRQATYLSDFIQSFTYHFMLVSTHISNVEDLVFHLRAAPVGLWLVSVEIGHNPRFVACRRFASQFDHLPMKICKKQMFDI